MMKNAKWIYFIVLLLSSNFSYACLHGHDLMMVRARAQLIKDNFSEGKCITPAARFAEVDQQFKELTTHFDRDIDLHRNYARFLLVHGKTEQGLNVFAQIILSGSAEIEHTNEIFDWLSLEKIEGQPLKPLIMVRARDQLIKDNFNEGKCITPAERFTEVDQQFKALTTHFDHDIDLQRNFIDLERNYARFLLVHGKTEQGLNVFAKAMLSGGAVIEHANEFFDWLSLEKIEGQPLKPLIDEINKSIKKQDEFEKPTKHDHGTRVLSRGPNSQTVRVDIGCEESAIKLLALLKKKPTLDCYEAVLVVLLETFDAYGCMSAVTKFIGRLYLHNGEEAPALLKHRYACRCLVQEGKFARAIPLYESLLGPALDPSNPYQNSLNYNTLAICYTAGIDCKIKEQAEGEAEYDCTPEHLERLKKAASLYEIARDLHDIPHLTILLNLSVCQTKLKQYNQAYINMKEVMNASEAELNKFDLNRKSLERNYLATYLTILHKLGKTEEITEILLKKQQTIAYKNKRLAALVKTAQEEHEKELEHARLMEQELQKAQPNVIRTQPSPPSHSHTVHFGEETSQDISKSKKGKEPIDISVKKDKQKTRGVANEALSHPTPVFQPEKSRSLIHIEALTANKNAHKIFDKLFAKYEPGVNSDSNVKISLNEISCFFEALEQDYDPSKGHGSHKKVTLNFQEAGSEAEEQMIILTNKNYLKPEQIKDIRLALVKSRIVPNNPAIIKKLQQDGLL